MIGLMVLGFVMWLARHPVGRWVARWQAHRNHPETVAARKLRASCLANDATAAHAAWMSWLAARRVVDGSDRLEQFLAIDQQRPLRTMPCVGGSTLRLRISHKSMGRQAILANIPGGAAPN